MTPRLDPTEMLGSLVTTNPALAATLDRLGLFPMIRELAAATTAPSFHCGSLANPIRVIVAEHDTAGDLLARIRTATGDYAVPADGCASYQALYAGLAELEADTHLHVHKENNVLFPAVLDAERAVAGR